MQEVYTDHESIRDFEVPPTQVEQTYLYEWFFHYNPNTQLWNAIPRGAQTDYWNNASHPDVLRAKHLNILLAMLERCQGDAEMVREINSDDVK